MKKATFSFILVNCFLFFNSVVQAHEITFCGEVIPVSNDFVAQKLMNVIKRQIPQVNMPQLRKSALTYFPMVERYLSATGLPSDFKYLPIIESGFVSNATSVVGAQGFWQLMPSTAQELGLKVSNGVDQRNDFDASTLAACKVLASYYLSIRKKYGISSWVLTAAAYNFGIGNIFNNIKKQGKDYFSMNLNPETAVYVYKIIAVKELFEYPELYLKNFNYNIFNPSTKSLPKITDSETKSTDADAFQSMEVKVKQNDGQHPENISQPDKYTSTTSPINVKYVGANIKGKYKNFTDGSVVTIELQEDLKVKNRFTRSGNAINGTGWIINDRVFIDLGYDDHDVILYDTNSKQGIPLSALKNNEPLLLKVQISED